MREEGVPTKALHMADSSGVLLSTALINILDSCGNEHTCRVLLDSGSQPNLITDQLVKRLGLPRTNFSSSIEGINNIQVKGSEWVVASIGSRSSDYSTKTTLLVLPHITSELPSYPIDKTILKIPHNIKLADSKFYLPAEIEALIGAELFYELLSVGRIPLAQPRTMLQNTKLSWIATGKIITGENNNTRRMHSYLVRDELSNQLEKFWSLKNYENKVHLSKQEKECEEHFSSNVGRDQGVKYIVRLPFNKKIEELGQSFNMARRRFFSLERKLEKNPKLKEMYSEFIRQFEELGHMQLIKEPKEEGYYMPHQAVIRDSSLTTKLRVVFDASARTTTGVSLNEAMLVGPNVQDMLFTLLLRFRRHPIALSADVEKMFRQFWVHPEDREFQRILWRYNINEPLRTYELKTITYGTAAAPFLSVRCLKQLAEDEGAEFSRAAEALKKDFYVDDFLSGADSVDEAKQLRDDIATLTSRGGLRLCKWISNCQEVMDDIPEKFNDLNIKLDLDQETKILGISWDPRHDDIKFNIHLEINHDCITKRSILSQAAQLYDPLGLVAPVIVFAKIQLQELWKLNLNWDEPVPQLTAVTWMKYLEQLPMLEQWRIPRAVRAIGARGLQLHGFSDASEKAYGACLFVRWTLLDQSYSLLLCSKSRVAPLKSVSLPRLELCAALLLSKLYRVIIGAWNVDFELIRFWSDSTIALAWINSSPHELKTFIANRVVEIQELTSVTDWKHVSSADNPADHVSRGQLPEEFIANHQWKHGPSWLCQDKTLWPNHELEKIDLPEKK